MKDAAYSEGNLLPLEILLTIFEFLPIKDIKNASLTCKDWFKASMHSTVMDRRVLNIGDKYHLLFNNSFYKTNSFKPLLPYNSVKIFYSSDRFAGLKINYEKSIKNIFKFLNQFENLNSLDIFLNFFTMSINNRHCHYDKYYVRNQSFSQLKSMKVLKIVLGGRELSCLLSLFLELMPELVHLDINLRTHWEDELLCLKCSREKLLNYLNEGKKRIKTFILYADPETMDFVQKIN